MDNWIEEGKKTVQTVELYCFRVMSKQLLIDEPRERGLNQKLEILQSYK